MVPPFLWKILTQLKGCRDARFLSKIHGFKTIDYPQRLSNLELNKLYLTRIISDLIFVYKIFTGLTLCNIYRHINLRIPSSTRGHTYKLDYPRVSDNMTRRFLMCRIVNYWNTLPITALECTSTYSFRNCVCRLIPDNIP